MDSERKNIPDNGRRGARRGVALLIVLGLLGLLLVSAVGFAVLMRTERSAATNYRHTASARQILFAALARAIEDLDADIGGNLSPDWTTDPFTFGTPPSVRTLTSPEKVLFSYYDPAGLDDEPVIARILTKDVMTYIPALFHRRLTEGIYNPPEWIPIKHNGSVVGRYAYAVIDTSGLLDANLVHNAATNRWMGASMGEVRLDPSILTIQDLTNVTNFAADRTTHGRYETIAELAALNTGLDPAKLSNFEVFSIFSTNVPSTDTAPAPVNLFGLKTAADVEANFAAIADAFRDAGVSGISGFSDADQIPRNLLAFAALADYIDSDSIMSMALDPALPQMRFDRPCTEKLPLLNSFALTMKYVGCTEEYDGDGNVIGYRHTVEHRPRLKYVNWPLKDTTATDAPFYMRGVMYIQNEKAGVDFDYGVSPSLAKTTAFFATPWDDPVTSDEFYGPDEQPYGFTIPDIVAVSEVVPTTDPPKFEFKMYVAFEVYNANNEMCYQFPGMKPPNQFLDGMPDLNTDPAIYDMGIWATTLDSISVEFKAVEEEIPIWFECVDPRFAFRFGGCDQWYCNNPDIAENAATPCLNKFYPPSPDYEARTPLYKELLQWKELAVETGLEEFRIDGFHAPEFCGTGSSEYDDVNKQLVMHVANAPLQTPGELAYLLIGPWETIKLYDHYPDIEPKGEKYHKILDYFEVRDPAAEPKGKVSLNSATADVLNLLYLDMPLRTEDATDYKSPPAGVKAKAAPMAKKCAEELGALLSSALEPFTPSNNLSDLAKLYTVDSNPVPTIKQYLDHAFGGDGDNSVGEFEREAVIRNIAGLLTTKQQLFTIVLRADAFTTRFGSDKLKDGTVLSSAIAVAQVYRDPVATVDKSADPTPDKTNTSTHKTYHKTIVRMLKILE